MPEEQVSPSFICTYIQVKQIWLCKVESPEAGHGLPVLRSVEVLNEFSTGHFQLRMGLWDVSPPTAQAY